MFHWCNFLLKKTDILSNKPPHRCTITKVLWDSSINTHFIWFLVEARMEKGKAMSPPVGCTM